MNTLCLLGLPLGGRALGAGLLGYQVSIKKKFGSKLTVLVYVGERVSNIVQMIEENYPAREWKIILGGYSWGADNTSIVAGEIENEVSYLFALQPSVYYRTTPLKPNVTEAYCCFNPYWFETAGLGFQKLSLAPGNTKTKLVLDPKRISHGGVQYDPDCKSKVLAGIGRAVAA